MGGQESAVAAGHGNHGHNAAGSGPNGLQLGAVFGEQIAGILLFSSYQEALLALIIQRADGVALIQIGNYFLFYLHGVASSISI